MKKNVNLTVKHSKITLYNEGDVFSFGKYRNRPVIEVLVTDPQYILWVDKNVPYVMFKKETIDRAVVKLKQKEQDYYRRKKIDRYEDEPLTSNILGL